MTQRIDKWLVYARFAKHRAKATALIEGGAVRLNKQRISKVSQPVKPGDVLTIALPSEVRVVRVRGDCERRGSASVASQLYEELTTASSPHVGHDEKPDAAPQPLC